MRETFVEIKRNDKFKRILFTPPSPPTPLCLNLVEAKSGLDVLTEDITKR